MEKKGKERTGKKEQIKRIIEMEVMFLGFFLMFGIMIMPSLRDKLAKALDFLLNPVVTFIGPENFLLVILFLAIITGIYTSLIQKYTMNFELMEKAKGYQKRMKELQKEYMEAKKENNKHKLKKIEKKRAVMMKKQSEFSSAMLKQQFKPMAYICIVTLPIFMWIYWYMGMQPVASAIFPLIGEKNLADFFFIFPLWVLWYLICSIPTAQVIRKVLGIRGAM